MAKRKAPELSPEAVAANAAGEAGREKENQARQKNAEKQRRFRDSMKEAGYKRVTLWDAPSPAGQPGRMAGMGYSQVPAWGIPPKKADRNRSEKIALAVYIHESSLHAGAKIPQVQEALKMAGLEFLKYIGESPDGKAVYNDFIELTALLGDPFGKNNLLGVTISETGKGLLYTL